MRTKPGFHIELVKAVLIMLAMVCGLLLLPGNNLHSSLDCTSPDEADSGPASASLHPKTGRSCR